ncbi:MAG: DUF2177 family protein [Deltaproteobacteria bacterium]|nr:DUF2177 family protein [Deltaproteobacteria bacterium]
MLREYLTALIAFCALDGVWLGVVAPPFYRAHIGHLMSDRPDLGAAALFYLLFLWGLQRFVLRPTRGAPLAHTAREALAFGVVTYATFDLTAVAVLKGFPYAVAAVDILWGGALSVGVSLLTRLAAPRAPRPAA